MRNVRMGIAQEHIAQSNKESSQFMADPTSASSPSFPSAAKLQEHDNAGNAGAILSLVSGGIYGVIAGAAGKNNAQPNAVQKNPLFGQKT